jgi:hypothetical protein
MACGALRQILRSRIRAPGLGCLSPSSLPHVVGTSLPGRYVNLLEPTLREPYHPGGMWLIHPDGYTALKLPNPNSKYSAHGSHLIGKLRVYHQGGLDTYCAFYAILNLINLLKFKDAAQTFAARADRRSFMIFPPIGSGAFTAENFEDDGESEAYRAGDYGGWRIEVEADTKSVSVHVQCLGTFTRLDPDLILPEREMRAVSILRS